jgi:hypothetical protein
MWSVLEISAATICACLPALRSLLSTRFPSVFDNKSTYHSDKTDFDVTDSHTLFPRTPRKVPQKVGPSYNKRVITSPDDDILMPTPKFETFPQRAKLKDKEIKVWINPKFGARGTLLDFEYVGPDSDLLNIAKMELRDSGPSSNGTSLWGVNNLHPMLSSHKSRRVSISKDRIARFWILGGGIANRVARRVFGLWKGLVKVMK